MRPFEIILSFTIFLVLLRLAWRKPPRWLQYTPDIALVVCAFQLVFEGYRWQMLGLYILALVLFLAAAPRRLGLRRGPEQPRPDRRPLALMGLITILAALLTLILAAPAYLFPIPKIPQPSGPYPVGTITRLLVDESRPEIYSPQPQAARRFVIQVWYPAQAVEGMKQAAWMPEATQVAPAIAEWLDLPEFSLDHLRYVRIPSYTNAPLAQGDTRYPLLLFSHGWGGFRSQTAFLMHELASHGYVVVALEYPYASLLTVFPDGSLAEHNPQILPDAAPEEEYDRAAQRLVDQWAGDLAYALDMLEQMNQPGHEFAGQLDLRRIGVFGHSTGGGATVEFCFRDPRCKAGLGLDTWMTPVSPQARTSSVSQPFLFLFSELWPTPKNERLFSELLSHSPQAQSLTIAGTDHYDFTDLPLLTPLAAQLKLKGPLEGKRVLEIINTYTLAFFDQELKGIPATLLVGPSDQFPEVRY